MRLSHLGDVVSALPVFHALRRRYPDARIAWVVQHEFADLLSGMRGLERLFLFERRGGWRAWPKLRRELRAFDADLVVDAQSNLKSAAAVWCAGAPRRVGLDPGDRRERFGAFVLNETAPPLGSAASHATERMLHLARHVGGAAAVEPSAEGALELTDAELAGGRERVREHLGVSGTRAWILCVSTPGDVRSWPAEHWSDLARRLARRGDDVLLLSGPSEHEVGARLARELGTGPGPGALRHWVGQRGLRTLAAFFRAAGERGARVIACDSGPMHVAAACGLPVVTLDGPQDAERTGPWPRGPRSPHVSLRSARTPECAPCFERRCRHARGPVCMGELEPERVERATARA